MPFGDPSQTPYDLRFSLLGFPVRIHPFFWVASALLGASGNPEPVSVLLWVGCVLVSILVHELGHALLQRRYGGEASIVLYSFGGLAMATGVRSTPLREILIALAGPFAGFLFAAVLIAPLWLSGGTIDSPNVVRIFNNLLFINIVWGIVNLLPIYPLDGGRVSRELFTLVMEPYRGVIASLWLSILCAAGLAAWLFSATGGIGFNVILLGLLAYNNYQTLEAYRGSRGGRR